MLPRSDAFVHGLRADFYVFDKDVVLFPISFSVPKDLVVRSVPEKTAFALNDSTRSFTIKRYQFGPLEEADYHRNIRRHRFGDTRRKGGHDCLRHYELLANGCLPVLHDLENLPRSILTTLPRPLLAEATRLFRLPWSGTQEGPGYVDARELEASGRLAAELLNYTARRLTTEATAHYLLNTMGIDAQTGGKDGRPPRVLYLPCVSLDNFPSFLAASVFHGLVSLLGDNVVDVPEYDYTYAFSEADVRHDPSAEERFRRDLWGQGYTLGFKLRRRPHLNRSRIPERIKAQEFDLIVFARMSAYEPCNFWYSYKGNLNTVPQFFEDVWGQYPLDRVALLYGDDSGLDDAVMRTNVRRMGSMERGLGIVFMREMLPFVGEGPPSEVLRPVDERLLQPGCFGPEWLEFFARWRGRSGRRGLKDCLARGHCADAEMHDFRASPKFMMQRPNLDPPALHHFCRTGFLLRAALLVQMAAGQERCQADPHCLESCTFCLGTYARELASDMPPGAFKDEFGVSPAEVLFLLSMGCAHGGIALQPAAAYGQRQTFAVLADMPLRDGGRGPLGSFSQVLYLLRQGFLVLLVGPDTADSAQGPLRSFVDVGRLRFYTLAGPGSRCDWMRAAAGEGLLGLHIEDVADGGAAGFVSECLGALSPGLAPAWLSLQLPRAGDLGARDLAAAVSSLASAGYMRFKVSQLGWRSLGGPIMNLAPNDAIDSAADAQSDWWSSADDVLEYAQASAPAARQLHAA